MVRHLVQIDEKTLGVFFFFLTLLVLMKHLFFFLRVFLAFLGFFFHVNLSFFFFFSCIVVARSFLVIGPQKN